MERRFRIKGVNVKISSEQALSKEIVKDIKSLLDGRWQFQNIKRSMDFLRRWNSLQTLAQKKKINFLEYSAALVELRKFRANNFGTFDVSTIREFVELVEDDYEVKRKITIELSSPIEELEPLTLTRAYRSLGFGKNKFTEDVFNRYIIAERKAIGPPPPYETSREFIKYLKSIDIKNDIETFSEMIAALKDVAKKFGARLTTDTGSRINAEMVDIFEKVEHEFEKLAADPTTSPSGAIIGEQTADTRLAKTLEELAEEAWNIAQTPDEKDESFLHRLLHQNDATLCGPWDLEESVEVKT